MLWACIFTCWKYFFSHHFSYNFDSIAFGLYVVSKFSLIISLSFAVDLDTPGTHPASFHTLFTFQGIEKRPLLFIKGEYIAVPPSFIFSSYSITGTTPGYLTAMFGYPAWKLPSVSSYLKLPRSPWAVLSVREGYILLFFNAFSYKLFNMISSKVRFVKEFREFSESLKEFSYIHPIVFGYLYSFYWVRTE